MPKRRYLSLCEAQEISLRARRDHHPRPYVRERAAALLKIAGGMAPAVVARSGLLRPPKPDTIYAWLDRYQDRGVVGLYIQAGRGRKPAFSPCAC